MSKFQKLTSIESFAHVYRHQQYFDTPAVVQYGAKIKLHGSNAAVRLGGDGTVVAQSRSRDIFVGDDNYGFAAWVKENEEAWRMPSTDKLRAMVGDVIYYGEWGGLGIQKGDAVTKLDAKYFFVFAVRTGDNYITTPADIELTIPDLDNIIVIPWDIIFEESVDFGNADECESFGDMLNERVKDIEERDPFIHGIFGIDAPGEGWVISPVCNPGSDPLDGQLDVDWYNHLTFKVKVEGHNVNKGPSAARDIVVPEGVSEFVEMFVTEARCQQGLSEELGGNAIPEKTGHFLKWVNTDIIKESVEELSDAGLVWKDVQRGVAGAARTWFLEKCKEI